MNINNILSERILLQKIRSMLQDFIIDEFGFDDLSAVPYKDHYILFKTDGVSLESDFLPGMSFNDLGWKLVVSNVSDFAAKGIKPQWTLINLNIRKGEKLENIEDFYRGLKEAFQKYHLKFLGGDLGFSKDFSASLFMIAVVDKQTFKSIPRRNGAQPGDFIYTTGFFGLTSIAYKILFENFKVNKRLRDNALKAVYRPVAKLREGILLRESKMITSSVDSSDGLAKSIYEIALQSKVGAVIENIPIHPLLKKFLRNINFEDLLNMIFYQGGEEYEIIFTIRKNALKEFMKYIKRYNIKAYYLGKIIRDQEVYLKINNKIVYIEDKGWDSLSGWSKL